MYNLSVNEVLDKLKTSENGLSSNEAENRLNACSICGRRDGNNPKTPQSGPYIGDNSTP